MSRREISSRLDAAAAALPDPRGRAKDRADPVVHRVRDATTDLLCSPLCRSLLDRLLRYAASKATPDRAAWQCFPSLDTLADDMGLDADEREHVDVDDVRAARDEAKALGVVDWNPRGRLAAGRTADMTDRDLVERRRAALPPDVQRLVRERDAAIAAAIAALEAQGFDARPADVARATGLPVQAVARRMRREATP